MNSRQLDKAAETCDQGIPFCDDKAIKAEMAYNVAFHYYELKDRENFERWAKKTEKWATKVDQFMTNLDKMKADIDK